MTRMRKTGAGGLPESERPALARLNSLQKQFNELRNRLTAHPEADAVDAEDLGQLAREIAFSRQRRADMFGDGDLFGEPAWDIFLALYAAQEAQHKLSVTGVCGVAGVPLATGLRWIEKLEKEDWVYRAPDPVDRRRSWLLLTERASNVMRDYLAGMSLRARHG